MYLLHLPKNNCDCDTLKLDNKNVFKTPKFTIVLKYCLLTVWNFKYKLLKQLFSCLMKEMQPYRVCKQLVNTA